MLYRPEAHEPLTDEQWDEQRVRHSIGAIVADADAAFDPDGLWPAHDWDGWNTPQPLKVLYVGAAGVLWALDALRRRGLAETEIDLEAAARRTLEAWRAEPDFMREIELPSTREAGLLSGESGILVVAWRLTGDGAPADDLLRRVRENEANEANEVMWGAPGTLLAAQAMLDWTGEERWAEAVRASAEAVRAGRDEDGLWTQRLYGETYRGLGPAHGLVGNVRALRRAGDLDPGLARQTVDVLRREAVVEDGLANWFGAEGSSRELKLQWCSGAPGVVVSAADYLDEDLLLAGAELVWGAGPPGAEKGAGICHGTAGNGYALLKTFERTGDELWLDRARRFAVHALEQVEAGEGRYSLWTGGVGTAIFAADCLGGLPSYPIMDAW